MSVSLSDAIAAYEAFQVSLAQSSLRSLGVEFGCQTLSDLASKVGCNPALLEQVDLHRQALPLDLAAKIAIVLSWAAAPNVVQLADVVACVSRVTSVPGPDSWLPWPPEFGDPFTSTRLTRTLPVIPP